MYLAHPEVERLTQQPMNFLPSHNGVPMFSWPEDSKERKHTGHAPSSLWEDVAEDIRSLGSLFRGSQNASSLALHFLGHTSGWDGKYHIGICLYQMLILLQGRRSPGSQLLNPTMPVSGLPKPCLSLPKTSGRLRLV